MFSIKIVLKKITLRLLPPMFESKTMCVIKYATNIKCPTSKERVPDIKNKLKQPAADLGRKNITV